MCGRFVAGRDPASFAAALRVEELPEQVLPANYNVAPTQQVAVVRESEGVRRMDYARWGLIPSWAKDPGIGNRMINARSETVAQKPAYRSSFATRRCVVPADGFYEWRASSTAATVPTAGKKSPKTPFYLHPNDGSALVMAGLYAWWRDPAVSADSDPAAWVMSTTILTMPAMGPIREIHDRQPVLVAADALGEWLDPQSAPGPVLDSLLEREWPDYWSIEQVSTAVNSPRNNAPDLLAPVADGG